MDRARYEVLVQSFIDRDPESVTAALRRLLTADSSHVPSEPASLEAVLDAVLPYFRGTDDWSSPLHLENVRGPASAASLVGALACLLKNPNLCTRADGQASSDLERTAIAELADIVIPGVANPAGVFTAGGTHSNLYGAKLGIEKVLPGTMRDGLGGAAAVGVASEASHYGNRTVAGWLGIGANNLHLVPTDRSLAMRPDALADTLDRLYREGKKVAYVVATFGTTDGFGCDDVAAVRRVIDAAAGEHGVIAPQLHVDAAVGWALAFLRGYDTESNPLKLTRDALPVVRRAQALGRGLRYADSLTVDFHKMGWGHYPGSAFLVGRRDDLRHLARSPADAPYFPEARPDRDPALFTLDTSRPGFGPYTVMASLRAIGPEDWQMLVGRSLELAAELKRRLGDLRRCAVLNPGTPGASVLFWVLPKGQDAKALFDDLERGRLTPAEAGRCFAEVRDQFARWERARDPARDARLGFTTNVGYRPRGYDLPAWKAVFFHPRTDEAVIDRLIDRVAELS